MEELGGPSSERRHVNSNDYQQAVEYFLHHSEKIMLTDTKCHSTLKNLKKIIPEPATNNDSILIRSKSKPKKLEGEEDHLEIKKLKIRFITALNRFDSNWKNDSMFSTVVKQSKVQQETELVKKFSIRSERMTKSQSNFFVSRSKSGVQRHKRDHRKSQTNIVRNLLNEQENIMNQKFLSKRLKSQRENYILKTNSNLKFTDARMVMTSLQKVRTLRDNMDVNLLPIAHSSSQQNLNNYYADNNGNLDLKVGPNRMEFITCRDSEIFSQNKSKVFLTDPDFVKYAQDSQYNRKTGTAPVSKNQIPIAHFKQVKRDTEDYHTFRESLRTKRNNGKFTPSNTQNKFLSQLNSMKELDDLLNPANRDIDKDEEKEMELALMLKDVDNELLDNELEKKLLEVQNTETLEGFNKYMKIMLGRHLKFNDIEEAEIKNRKLEDLDLDTIIEHYISKKSILEKASAAFIQFKSIQNK